MTTKPTYFMMAGYALTAGALLAVSACGEDAADAPPVQVVVGADAKLDCRADSQVSPVRFVSVVGGTEEPPEGVRLSQGQIDAVGALVTRQGGLGCSATLVADDVVLTAAHCVVNMGTWEGEPGTGEDHLMDTRSLRFAVGEDVREPDATFAVKSMHLHPEAQTISGDLRRVAAFLGPRHDIAVLVLEEKVSESLPEVRPIPILRESMEGRRGQKVILGGYGHSSFDYMSPGYNPANGNSRRHWTSTELERLNRFNYALAWDWESSTAHGDSGAGHLVFTEDGSPRLIGVLSAFANLGGREVDADLGSVLDVEWLSEFVGEDPCQGMPIEGSCEGDVLSICDGEVPVVEDCGARGMLCGASACGDMRCVVDTENSETTAGCGELDYHGRCAEGEVVEWCLHGQILTRDCSQQGQVCGESADPKVGYTCLDEGTSGPASEERYGEFEDFGVEAPLTCSELWDCTQGCGADVWCNLECVEPSPVEAILQWNAFGQCQMCSGYGGMGCAPGSEHHLACEAECGPQASKFGTPGCMDCLNAECGYLAEACQTN